MTLFEFIDALFDKKAYSRVTQKDKKTYFFNLNRFLSNKYPLQVNEMNNVLGISQRHVPYVVDYWHLFLSSKFVSKPNWFFWKTSIASSDKGILEKYDKELISKYQKTFGINNASLEIMINIFPDEIKKELDMYKNTIEAKSRKKPKKNDK